MVFVHGLTGSHHLEGGFLECVSHHFEEAQRSGRRTVLGWSQAPRPKEIEAAIVDRPAVLLPYRSKASGGDSLVAGALIVQLRPALTWTICQAAPERYECVPFNMDEPVRNVYEVLAAPVILPVHERIDLAEFTHAGSRNAVAASAKLDGVLRPISGHPAILAAFEQAEWLGENPYERSRLVLEYENFLRETSSLDEPVEATRRLERGILRKLLFAGKETAPCAGCGRELPIRLLWASHVKCRASCALEELRDFRHIVMPLCKLGCDDCYEQGFWKVDDTGTIRVRHANTTEDLRRFLAGLEGRGCPAWNASSREYFAAHARQHE